MDYKINKAEAIVVETIRTGKFKITTQTPIGIATSGALIGGETAAIIASKKRENTKRPNPYVIDNTTYKDAELYKSDLGTSVYADVTFGTKTKDTIYEQNGITYVLPVITFQAILIDVSFPRNIVKTTIQGRDGTVKEYIGEGDAVITFRGIITGKNGHYPLEEVNALKRLIKAPIPIPVTCAFLQNLDIHSVIFEDRSLGQDEGGYSYQSFTLNAISDTPQELTIT